LADYWVVDEKTGRIGIPVDRAMELVVHELAGAAESDVPAKPDGVKEEDDET
jgi:hypothetical protein